MEMSSRLRRMLHLFGCFALIKLAATLEEDARAEIQVNQTFMPLNKPPFANCRILISEFEIAAADSSKHFVELSKHCTSSMQKHSNVNLDRFKLLFISGSSKLLAMCSLRGQCKDRPGDESKLRYFYVVGSDGVDPDDVSMKFSQCQIDSSLKGKFPSGRDLPIGILLIHGDTSKGATGLELYSVERTNRTTNVTTTTYQSKNLYGSHFEKIYKHLQDFQVYGSLTVFSDCDVFRTIYKKFTENPVIILRDWITQFEDGKTINRCGNATDPFRPDAMKYSLPSPGSDNRCASGVEFCLEKNLVKLSSPKKVEVIHGEYCYITHEHANNITHEITEGLIDNHFDVILTETNDNTCDLNDFVEGHDVVLDFDLSEKEISVEATEHNINDYLKFYRPELVNRTEKYIWKECSAVSKQLLDAVSNDINVTYLLHPDICYWIDYEVVVPYNPRMFCKLCRPLYAKQVLLDRSSSPLLTQFLKHGKLHSGTHRKDYNQKMILSHLDSKLHKISVQYFTNMDQRYDERTFIRAMMETDGEYYKFFAPTQNLIMSVYQAVQMGLPFFKFHLFTDTLNYVGFDTCSLHHNADGAKKSLMIISQSMHHELLYHLKNKKPIFNVIIDDSTDISGASNSEILFQTFDANQNVKTYHYGLLNLKHGLAGADIFRVFYEQIQQDKLENLLKTNLVGMTSDGATTLTSVFYKELVKKVNENVTSSEQRQILLVICHAHRLELIMKTTFKKHAYLGQMNKKVNEIANFFNAKAVKRRGILRTEALKLASSTTYNAETDNIDKTKVTEAKRFTPKKIHKIRWVTHQMSAYKCILNKYEVLVKSITIIVDTPGILEAQRKTALKLLTYLHSPTFLSHLAFLADISSAFSKLSLKLQIKNSNHIGKYKERNEAVEGLQLLTIGGGYELLQLINRATVHTADNYDDDDTDVTFIGRLTHFENSQGLLDGIKLNEVSNISLYREIPEYMNTILNQFNTRFSQNMSTNSFDMFIPQELKFIDENDEFGKSELEVVNSAFGWKYNDARLFTLWKRCVNSIVQHDDFDAKKTLAPAEFWLFYLKADGINWTEDIRNVITTILVTPCSSASAEQSFSLVTALKNSKRYSLDTPTVDAELRIKLNGVKDLTKVNFFAYARQFIKSYTKADDDYRARPRVVETNEYDSNNIRLPSIFEKPQL